MTAQMAMRLILRSFKHKKHKVSIISEQSNSKYYKLGLFQRRPTRNPHFHVLITKFNLIRDERITILMTPVMRASPDQCKHTFPQELLITFNISGCFKFRESCWFSKVACIPFALTYSKRIYIICTHQYLMVLPAINILIHTHTRFTS